MITSCLDKSRTVPLMCTFGMLSKQQRKLKDLQLLKEHISKRRPSVHPSSFASQVIIARIDEEIQRISARTSKKTKKAKSCSTLRTLRILLIDAPMTALFGILMISILVQKYYVNYVSPTIDAANWADDYAARLGHEFTYYSRECDATDVTADSIQSVAIDENKHTPSDIVENLMVHGMSPIPSLVDKETSNTLREYILKRNTELTNDEVIPLDGQVGRWSFGIHANEDPSVAAALEQLSSNPMLESSLVKILGRNPAVAEITAITVAPGAGSQGWHSDVKQLGNSLKYAQTFTHSYSLFVPLQNVTAEMGATELCPGTHYCGSEDLWDTCVEAGFQAAGPRKEDVWKVGDGLMMNQKMWHRGGAYTATEGLYRVVFIVTFISRPDPGVDHRQLSHGTYFHIHPRMYGHTLKDLQNAHINMAEPFASLRSLGIWKPPDSDWGWDWATSSSVRIANGENGYSVGDLFDFVEGHSLALMVPLWLHGAVDEEGGWQLYFKETLENFVNFFTVLYFVVLVAIFTFSMVVDLLQNFKHHHTASFLKRIVYINATILLIAHIMAVKVKNTQYAKSIDNKTIFARPFMPRPTGTTAEATIKDMDSSMMDTDLTNPPRPTAVPEKNDILFGNRHDSHNIGFYVNYLNYHPGNKKWRKLLATYSPLYNSYSGLPSVFQTHIVSTLEEHKGRMLTQNYYGGWVVMNEDDKKKQKLKGLLLGTYSLYSSLDQEISIISAEARHGILMRGSRAMPKETLKNLNKWRDLIAPRSYAEIPKGPIIKGSFLRTSLFEMETIQITPLPSRKKLITGGSASEMKIGDTILVNYRGSGNWMPACLIFKEFSNYGVVEFDFGRERSNVYLKMIEPFRGIQEGDKITVLGTKCERCPITFEQGSVLKAHQDITCDVVYRNGDVEERVPKYELALRFEE